MRVVGRQPRTKLSPSALQGGGVRGGGWFRRCSVAGGHLESPTSPNLSAPKGGEELKEICAAVVQVRGREGWGRLRREAFPGNMRYRRCRETAMKLMWFHLMPYTKLPDNFRQQHNSVWVDIPRSLFDPEIGHRLYNEFMDELEYAASLDFDAVCVNEHHAN